MNEIPIGWYPDQTDPKLQRYWNGDSWSPAVPRDAEVEAGMVPPTVSAPGPASPASPRKRKSLKGLWISLVAVVVILAGGAVVGLVWKPWQKDEPPAPTTFAMKGTLTLYGETGGFADDSGEILRSGTTCMGQNGYDDIVAGADVNVSDEKGTTIAVGELEGGYYQFGSCTFRIAVTGVPLGKKFYKVEVTHRGTVQFPPAKAQHGQVKLSLGSP